MTGTEVTALVGVPVPDDAVLSLLRGWLPHQRWFPAKGTDAAVERIGVVTLLDPAGEADVGLHLLRLPSGAVIQVPLTVRPADATTRPGTVGVVEVAGAPSVVVDGCHDRAFVRAWLAAAHHDGAAPTGDVEGPDAMRVLTGEQSNTSVLLPSLAPPAILKVFRGVALGDNPDVVVPLALHHGGWDGVPRPMAWLTASWPAPPLLTGEPGGTDTGHLGVLSELVVGAQDGFELACALAGAGSPFDDLAAALGRTTAQMHRALHDALPVDASGPADPDAVVTTLLTRAAAAREAAPVLVPRTEAIERVLRTVGGLVPLPPLQRVHGDYHLGQALHSPARGWAVLDFEGEPQASAQERARPDLALRDLAGMLRSIDYAAAVGGATSTTWASDARASLVAAYLEESGHGSAGAQDAASVALLRALELDKALYEVVYETRNRPSWVSIPLAGVDRLLEQPTAGDATP